MQGTTKRAMDILISLAFLLIAGLPMVLIGLLIKITSSGPVLFKQKRSGKGGKTFFIYKFRSMKYEEGGSNPFYDENRLTNVGKFIRKWRIDEAPQVFNVLFGDMSLVGPRPTLPYQVERYDKEQRRRLLVKPGMTGWAQINGAKAITWPERIELDLWYVDNWSIWLDIIIILRTPFALIRISRINAEAPPPRDDISSA